MRLVITGFEDGKKITAIRGFRAAFLGNLDAARDVFNRVEAGERVEWPLPDGASAGFVRRMLTEHGVQVELEENHVPVEAVISVLSEFHPELTVGALLNVLSTTENMVRRGALAIGGEW